MKDSHTSRIVIIVQARMGSERLPQKVMKEVMSRALLDYQIERLQRVKKADALVIATTENPQDDAIISFCENRGVTWFRGSEQNVLKRYYLAAKKAYADTVVRVTGDCPLIDPQIIDQVIEAFINEFPQVDYASNTLKRTYPRGMDTEVFSFEVLEKAYRFALRPFEQEHVTPYIYQHPDIFRLKSVEKKKNHSDFRLTVDTEEDFLLIKTILENLYPSSPDFTLADVIELLDAHPDWKQLNAHIPQKSE